MNALAYVNRWAPGASTILAAPHGEMFGTPRGDHRAIEGDDDIGEALFGKDLL
jgi:hypothetical protein